jgi:hypothetical protein
MKNFLRIAAGFVTTIVCLTYATPSTQIWIPSTDVQGFLNPHFGWDVYLTNTGTGCVSNGGITMGVLPFKAVGLEVGIDYRDINGDHNYPAYFNAKLGVPEDAFFKGMPAIAIGGFDFGTKDRMTKDKDSLPTNFDVSYGLIARTIPVIGRLSVGGYSGLGPDVLWTSSSGKVENSGVIASWDRTMTEISSKLWLGIDYMSGKNAYGALSFGASWNWAPNVSTIFGYDIWNDSDLLKPTFTFQLDINLK